MNLEEFEKRAGIKFVDETLLKQAFTHRSYINENRALGLGHNERLEFLGDAVLELVISLYLYELKAGASEGEMTALRSALVNAETCAKVATLLGVNDYLLLSKGEAKDIGRARTYILANTIEAIIGAIYLDQGYDKAREFILDNFRPLMDEIEKDGTWIDAKSLFQEKAQEEESFTPIYKTIDESGPDHDKHFKVEVRVGSAVFGTGEGKSKQDAEQDAARDALEKKGWK